MEKPFYALSESATLLGCTIADVIHRATSGEVTLLIGVPDGIRFQVFDGNTKRTEAPALLEPQLLALSITQCQKIELNGRTEQSDFRVGYLIAPDDTLQRLMPSYGGRLYLDHGWAFWRTCRGPYVSVIEIVPDRLFVAGDDVRRILLAKSQPTTNDKPKKKGKKPDEAVSANGSATVLSVEVSAQVDAADQEQGRAIAVVENAPTSTAVLSPGDASAEMPSKPLMFIRLKQVISQTGLSRSAIYDRLDPKSPRYDPSFPKQHPLGTGAVAWVEAEIARWMESRIELGKK